MAARSNKPARTNDRLGWWREARFGLFIHWGIYAVPAGVWKGKRIPSLGEWIMRNADIPISEYEGLARQFNPVKFNAEEWVALAKRAGMKYLVITAKHHDGFAMFRSPSCPYNIVDATPFGRDPMKELADACGKAGIRLCFYYSQAQDWHAPGGAGRKDQSGGGDWHKPTVSSDAFARYLEDKVKPQVTELLTQYGPIGLIWFDTPVAITKPQSEELRDLVHRLQPDCLVSGRVGHGVGDYGSMGDNQIPVGRVTGDWETPATINDTWGFKRDDHNWKPTRRLLHLLADLASKGVNYLLNVGPTAEGEIPAPSVERLEAIGRWLAVNGDAIYGARPSPYPYDFDWGRVTVKGRNLFLLFTRWPAGRFQLGGLRSRVTRAFMPAAPRVALAFTQERDARRGRFALEIDLPADAPDPDVSVVALELAGAAHVDDSLQQQPSGLVTLPAYLAAIRAGAGVEAPTFGRSNMTENWKQPGAALEWTFKLWTPGSYRVELLTAAGREGRVEGHEVEVRVGDRTWRVTLTKHADSDSARAQYHPESVSVLGRVELQAPGVVAAALKPVAISPAADGGLRVAELRLVPG
jgi:alpha-L-fucosidase